MHGNEPDRAGGATLLELVVVITLAGLLAAAGALMIGQMAPGYALAAENEQTLATTSAAVWMLRRDFAMAKSITPANGTTCKVTLKQAGGNVLYQLDSQGDLLRNGVRVLGGLSATCPFQPDGPQQTLLLTFTATGPSGQTRIPVNLTLASYER